MADDAVRDAFEEWAQADNRRLEPNECEADDRTLSNNHYYEDDTTNHAYIGWCAAWNRRPPDPAPSAEPALSEAEGLGAGVAEEALEAARRVAAFDPTAPKYDEPNDNFVMDAQLVADALLAKHAGKP